MNRLIIALACTLFSVQAQAQSAPNFYQGFIPTAAQWKSYFAGKQDALGYTPINKAGDRMLGPLAFVGIAPTLTSCGTSPSITGNNQTGTVTLGTGSPTGCTIAFTTSYVATPRCVVSWRANLAATGYTPSASALVLTQTGTSSSVVDYFCAATQ